MNSKSVIFRRDSLLLLLSSFVSFSGSSMHFIALSWLLLETFDDPVIVGVLVAIGIIPGVLISPIVGALTDRFNKKTLAIVMDLIRGTLVILLAFFCSINLEKNIFILIVVTLSLLISIFGNFYFPSITGILKSLYKKEELPQILSANSTLMQVSSIIGAGFAGLLVTISSTTVVLIVDAISFLISSFCLCFIPYSKQVMKREIKYSFSLFVDVKDGFVYSLKNSNIIFFILLGLLPSSSIYIINSLLGIYTKDILKLGSFAYGILDSSYALGSILVGILLIFLKYKNDNMYIILWGYIFLSISFFIIGLSNNLIFSSIGFALLGTSIMLINPIRRSMLMNIVEEEFIGRVTSLNWMIYSIFGPLLGLISTILIETISISHIFIFFSIISFISLLVIKLTNNNKKFKQETVSINQ